MIPIKDEVERTMASIEEKEEEGEELEEEGEDDAGDEEECDDNSDEEQEGEDAKKKEEEGAKPPACDEVDKSSKKKQAEGLNLNNEVVRMRKEVKRVRALIIRKLTRQIAALKKKKGKDAEIERNQRRAARLLEEIHAMKVLSPDLVTKTALQKKLDFEQECKNPKSTISDRAIARIATHPQFNKKIEDIKAAVKAFKEERMKDGKQGGKEKVQNKAGKMTLQSPPDKKGEAKSEIKEKDIPVDQEEIRDDDSKRLLKDTKDATVAEPEKSTDETTHSADTSDCQRREIPESKSLTPASIKSGKVKDIVKKTPQSKDAGKECDHKSAPETLHKKEDEDESDLESSDDEEKEYFDDSTEERFHKQSSQSEESDDDDFFIGKVSKFKKKKRKNVEGEKVKKLKPDSADRVQSELDELESRLKSKVLQSVFCSSLSASKPGGGRGTGRGRGGDKFRGQGKTRGGSGLNRDFNKQSKFAKQEKGADRDQGSKYSKPESSEGFSPVGRGRGRGRGDFTRQKDRRGGGVLSRQAPQQALHPSWEASRKRKEQQGQILAFQGKKIKFDDDD